jgi:uncharacterized protein (DUF1684 family)
VCESVFIPGFFLSSQLISIFSIDFIILIYYVGNFNQDRKNEGISKSVTMMRISGKLNRQHADFHHRVPWRGNRASVLLILCSFLLGGIFASPLRNLVGNEDQKFIADEMSWREDRDSKMRTRTSWLTIAGLFWLDEGENSFGIDTANRIRLPAGSALPSAGKFILRKGKVTVKANRGVELTVKDRRIKKTKLDTDTTGEPDIVVLNDLEMWIIERGERYAVRLRNLNNPPFKNYSGLDYFPPTKKYKILADYVPYPSPQKITLETMIGTTEVESSSGYVRFRIDDQEYRLEAFSRGSRGLFFIFRDETAGKETYEAARFMVARILADGKVDLNFNRAYNPPCAYTPYATCPLPPPQNHLKVRIEAGEKKYPGKHK